MADGPPTDVIADEERWIACNLRLTSLLRANARWRPAQGRLLDAETLATADRRIASARLPDRGRRMAADARPMGATSHHGWRDQHDCDEHGASDTLWDVNSRTIVYAAIGAALYGILLVAQIPIPGSTVSVRPAFALVPFFGYAFGPVVGFFTGLVGNAIGDQISGWGAAHLVELEHRQRARRPDRRSRAAVPRSLGQRQPPRPGHRRRGRRRDRRS